MKQTQKVFVPRAPSTELEYGDNVLVYRETSGKWEPRTFLASSDNLIIVS